MTVTEKLTKIRALMAERGVTCLYVPSDDYHQSEYVCDFFKARAYLSGFTGSAGTLVIEADKASLFTDGRYFNQAATQLEGSGIELMKSGTEGVPTPTEYIVSVLKPGDTLAYDGRCVSAKLAEDFEKKLAGVRIDDRTDFPGMIWENRPALPEGEIWELGYEYAGKNHTDKLADLREVLQKENCDYLVTASLCDIAWIYNLRGSDVDDTPVFLSYSIIGKDCDRLYANPVSSAKVAEKLVMSGVELKPYFTFYKDIHELKGRILLTRSGVNSAIISSLYGCEIVDKPSPAALMKAVKNETELRNTRTAHIADGLAVTKMMIELKYGEWDYDEISVDKRLLSYRKECAERLGVSFVCESFGAICAFGENGAIIHYKAEPESAAKLDKNAPIPMLMIDSGGQYLEGTTDITRTFALGELPEEVKVHYTLVAMGMLRLMNAKFFEGACGSTLDVLCRQPLWERGLDYRHGTGHGVGYLNSVHEGPNRFHFKGGDAKLEAGMVTTDEPGLYFDGSHGIRIENELLAVKLEKNEYGQRMGFENLTFCPIDLDAIDVSVMDKSDIEKLNAYHRSVYETLSPYLCAGDKEKLAYLTRSL